MMVSDQLHAPVAVPLGKQSPVLMGRWLSGFQRRSGRCGIEKDLLPPTGNQTPAFHHVVRRYTGRAIRIAARGEEMYF
jgi:hypothetical protein